MDAPLCRTCGNRHWGNCLNIGPAKAREPKLKPLPPHHRAWLQAHPSRSETWLRQHIADGFDVHHLDGNHGNDDPANLLLIEDQDHRSLHGRRVQHIVRDSAAKFDRATYQRELMRKRRAAAKALRA